MEADWELSQSLTSDGQGIRCAAILEPLTKDDGVSYRIVTGTQGGSLVEFQVPSGDLRVLPFQHDHAITALLAGPDCYITGCKDHQIRIFSATTHALVGTLSGHEKPVTSLAWADDAQHFLVSGSWDGTAKVWNVAQQSLLATLPDHENSVCVTGLPNNGDAKSLQIATGSAGMAQGNAIVGHTVRLWTVDPSNGTVQLLHSVANDHDGPIRAILGSSTDQMATCSNDGTVKLRDPSTGTTQSTLACAVPGSGDPPILLSLAAPPDASYLAAGTEDGHAVLWQGDTAPIVLRHTQTVWSVVTIPTTHDLLTCCQDGTVRIFTRATERMAPAAEREAFAAAAAAAAQKTSSGPSADEIAKLPKWEDQMTIPGRSEGQVQLFQKNGIAIAAQWSATSHTWIEVGEVTGRGGGETLNGVQYDHVFPIEVETNGGVANLQMGYNNGENPFVAAQRFVDEHQLPQYHLSQIADYIQQRVGQQPTTLGMAAPAAAAAVPAATYEFLPARTYKSFELPEKTAATTLEKMKNKIQEFGIASDDTTMQHISSLMTTLAAGNRYHSSKVTDTELKTVSHLLNSSPPNKVFPALDLARLAILHPDAASKSVWVTIVQRVLALATTETATLEGPSAVAVPMLALRLFANAFKGGSMAQQAVTTYLDPILDCAAQSVGSSNKNIRLSVATLVFNASFFLHQTKSEPRDATALKLVEVATRVVDNKAYEGEALFRVLVAAGTLVLGFPAVVKPAAQILTSKVELAASPHGPNVKAVAKEVYGTLQ